jgi:hypothetical protein
MGAGRRAAAAIDEYLRDRDQPVDDWEDSLPVT